ncbi:hypothetical protein [Brevibacillus laterosporus]|uniref:hypothetical protein n=1 Tax=Brevibacillus laterosporus TaxID=1465 RepID=UPI000E6CDA34|nr:hypothetical protein [Brevibacillus laterosporus]AYB37583.1 hypothetical protein D5F52_04415 [Brevibacillus laterosporus]MBM7111823.1 hypothetical protein [Brevibacillus laterosporus]
MALIVKISIKDDKGKETELELQETDSLSKLVIVQNVFNLFGIDKDILKTVKEFEKIGKAYSHFFANMKQEEEQTEEKQINSEEIRGQMIKGLQDNNESPVIQEDQDNQTNTVPDNVVQVSDYLTTGIKEDSSGTKRYKLRYECPICMNKGVHYVYKNSSETWCHACGVNMQIKAAHKEGFPNRDSFGNFYRAGDYYDYSS